MIKKVLSLILIFVMFVLLAACNEKTTDSNKLSIVCTTYAAYDWTRKIVGEDTDVFEVSLLGNGSDLHSFQPTALDMTKIHMSYLVVRIGGQDEAWIDDLGLAGKILTLFDVLDKNEKLFVGESNTYDEHIWLSLKLAQKMTNAICERVCNLDPQNGVNYQKNSAEYIQKLKQLDEEYRMTAENSKNKTVIFADRYPFAYLMKDYGIECISAFDGCTSDTNASFDTIAHLSEEIRSHNKDTVLVLENSAESVAEPLKAVLDGRTLNTAVMNSCQSTDKAVQDMGYIDVMAQNLESLKNALRG